MPLAGHAFHPRRPAPARGGLDRPSMAAALAQALALAQAGRVDRALTLLGKTLGDARVNEVAAFTTGFILLHGGHPRRALAWFERSVALKPRYPQAWAGKAEALRALSRFEDARACCDQALALCPGEAELLANRAFALHGLGQLDEALRVHDAALARQPGDVAALVDRCLILEKLGRLDEALEGLGAALELAPRTAEAWCNRGNVLQKLGLWPQAVESYGAALEIKPQFAEALCNRAAALRALDRPREALDDIAAALRLDARSPDAWVNQAIILQDLDRWQEAVVSYRRAVALRPLITVPAIRSPAAFSALFVMAPGAGNTPPDCLIGAAAHESRVVIFLPDTTYDHKLLGTADVIVNLISDVDASAPTLKLAAPFMERLGKPIVNRPERILRTDRQSIAKALAGIPDCVVSATRRYPFAALQEAAVRATFPCLARPAGTHGGDDFEKVGDAAELLEFAGCHPGAEFYLTPYVDYRSEDGFFRKYRLMFVGGVILPYHLAIGSGWKVHHASTDMASHHWMQEEERRFLEHPGEVFDARGFAALGAIARRVGLDYVGIDCALDRRGNVVVFEVNASMLVHQRNAAFPYKTEAVLRIKRAFDAMLARMAGADAVPA